MNGEVFVDTNVLVYARDTSEGEKQARAAAWLEWLWRSRRGRLSAQVLNEYYHAVTRKLRPGLSTDEARSDVRALAAWRPGPVDQDLVAQAWRVESRWRLSWWDALVVAAAQRQGCVALLTQDLQVGQDFDGVHVVNPFRTSPEAFGAG